jgi:hypothetical protein
MFFQPKRKTHPNQPTFDPMNNIISFVPAAGPSTDSGPGLYSDHMLAELVSLQEEMIAQLRLERLKVADTTDFLTDMIDHFLTGVIDQHEKAAAMLRVVLENPAVDMTNDALVVITLNDRPDEEPPLATRSA